MSEDDSWCSLDTSSNRIVAKCSTESTTTCIPWAVRFWKILTGPVLQYTALMTDEFSAQLSPRRNGIENLVSGSTKAFFVAKTCSMRSATLSADRELFLSSSTTCDPFFEMKSESMSPRSLPYLSFSLISESMYTNSVQ